MDQKILLIDDSAILRRIAANVLNARAGCGEVVTATRATEGFARACASGAGLILVDYQIAGFPRADFCRRLLDEPRTSRVPVVLLLGPGMVLPPREALPENIVDHLVKPFTPEQLLSTVRNVLGRAPVEPSIRPSPVAVVPPPRPADPPAVSADHHEVTLALSTAATTRRETVRYPKTCRPAVDQSVPVPTTRARGQGVGGRSSDPARVYNALLSAASRRETGVLRVSAGAAMPTEVYLEGGRIVVVATHDAARYSEDADSVVPPKVSLATLEDAVAAQALSGTPFLLALGSSGLLPKSAAVTLLHRFGQRHFARLWSEPTTTLAFDYETLEALPGFALRLEPRPEPVDVWLFEASRHLRSEDLATIVRHEGKSGIPRLHGASAPVLGQLPLDDQEREFVRWVDGRRNLATVAASIGVTQQHAFLLLHRFRCLGLMDYRLAGSAFVVTPRTSVRRVLPLGR